MQKNLDLPEPLLLAAEQQLHRVLEAQPAALSFDDNMLDEARFVLAASDFVTDTMVRNPDLFRQLLSDPDTRNNSSPHSFERRCREQLGQANDIDTVKQLLRRLRHRELARIAWRDIAGLASLEETVKELSWCADAMIASALAFCYQQLCADWGAPCNAQGEPQSLVVIAMGKLGAQELNFSSDVDLIFAFPEHGSTHGTKRTRSNEEFFIRLGQQLIAALNDITTDGMVYRVDMRLRPFGEAGPLVTAFDAMEAYYQEHGRDWERYAWIKARVCAGDADAGAQLLRRLHPFIYRRYLDYGMFDALREMHAAIRKEVNSKGLQDNIKLGPGGIREVEFIGQAFQLLRGGHEQKLQERAILPVLKILRELGQLSEASVDALQSAYCFLRDTEHRLQEVADQQTQRLPTVAAAQQRLAIGMGYRDWQSFLAQLETHRHHVRKEFLQVINDPDEPAHGTASTEVDGVWQQTIAEAAQIQILQTLGYAGAADVINSVVALRNSSTVRTMSSVAQQRLDKLMPQLLIACATQTSPEMALRRTMLLVSAVAKRSVYLSLLIEYPSALRLLVSLFHASPWLTTLISRYPVLLDELLDSRSVSALPSGEDRTRELTAQLADCDTDEECLLNHLRLYRHTSVMHVAAADIHTQLPLTTVSEQLSDIAETLLAAAAQRAWQDMQQKYGVPCYSLHGETQHADLVIIGYGKLGGRELGYGSDLDIIFLHDSTGDAQQTDGARTIDNERFFARLVQRLIHLLTVTTAAGRAYDVDLRLRPGGNAGLLVSSFDAFTKYQADNAWTWEQQALVRARAVCGKDALKQRFEKIRAQILQKSRVANDLGAEICAMRAKMAATLDQGNTDCFDLKQGRGGIADIEFMVQYAVLRWSGEHPTLGSETSTLRLLDLLAKTGCFTSERAATLKDAYLAFRGLTHQRALQEQHGLVDAQPLETHRRAVSAVWRDLFNEEI